MGALITNNWRKPQMLSALEIRAMGNHNFMGIPFFYGHDK
jgi:hypothetical protein